MNRLILIALALFALTLAACGSDDDDTVIGDGVTATDTSDGTTETPTEAAPVDSGDVSLERSVINQTIELLSEEPRNEFDPDAVIARRVSYADAYAEIAAEAPNLLGQLPSAPAGTAWLVRTEGKFIYTTQCPSEGCAPAHGTYFFIYSDAGELGQGIFVGER